MIDAMIKAIRAKEAERLAKQTDIAGAIAQYEKAKIEAVYSHRLLKSIKMRKLAQIDCAMKRYHVNQCLDLTKRLADAIPGCIEKHKELVKAYNGNWEEYQPITEFMTAWANKTIDSNSDRLLVRFKDDFIEILRQWPRTDGEDFYYHRVDAYRFSVEGCNPHYSSTQLVQYYAFQTAVFEAVKEELTSQNPRIQVAWKAESTLDKVTKLMFTISPKEVAE